MERIISAPASSELLPSDDDSRPPPPTSPPRRIVSGSVKLILSSKLVEPSWHVFVGLLVIKFSMLIRRTAARRRPRRVSAAVRASASKLADIPARAPQNTEIIEFKLPQL